MTARNRAPSTPDHRFPRTVHSARLGQMNLEEIRDDEDDPTSEVISRHYSPMQQVMIDSRPIRVIAWPPKTGVPDAAAFAAFIDSTWDAIWRGFDAMIQAAVPVVQSEIAESYPDDEPHPAAGPMMRRDTLNMIKIDATTGTTNGHEMMFWAAEFIGGHDLGIVLDHQLRPVAAYFDG